MKNVLKGVIAKGGYKLVEIQHKIKKLYILGDLSEDEMDELLTLAASGVSVDAERPEYIEMIQAMAEKITDLDNRVKVLEGDEPADPDVPGEYPAWKPWDGISNDYQKGAVVSHNGELWESTYEGQNVWEPGTVGDNFWVKYTPKK